MKDILDLEGKTAVITGGTSGIGKEIVRTFNSCKADTAFIGRDQKRGEEIENMLGKPKGPDICFYRCDVGKENEVKDTCSNIVERFSKVDILVLNASIEFSEAIEETDTEHWRQVLDVNTSGSFYFIRFLVGEMIKRGKGNIIFISSAVTINGGGGGVHYAASKAALKGICNKINYELLPKGIRANMISPGVIDTPMLRKKHPDDEETNKRLALQIPAGRIGKPVDIAYAALFLASEHSSFICGQDIVMDGGRTVFRNPHYS